VDIAARIDWTNVVNFDNYGTIWGTSTVAETEEMIEQAQANGDHINEWYAMDRNGLRLRIVRIADPEFLDTICVFPDECDDCGAPMAKLTWTPEDHHAQCPRRDPRF
jgi:hypothetical protein